MPNKRLINWTIIIRVLSFLLIVEAFFMLTGLPFAWFYNEPLFPLMISSLVTGTIGLLILLKIGKNYSKNIGKREGYLIVALTWVVISFFGTLPFLLSGAITHFADAFFETMSGLTTTGASILNDIESVPKNILYWRSMTHWIGGMGIIVLTVAILPFLGIGGMQLMVAEMPGIQPDKLHPRITATAKRFWGIYVLFTIAEILLLWAGEMDFFDSVNHSFATMATGGFSTRNASIAAFGPYSQYVIILFMIFAGTNFTLHYYALHSQFNKLRENQEFRVYLTIIALVTVYVTVSLVFFMNTGAEKAFRDALFTTVSILTTTGFVTTDYILWPYFIWIFIFALMFIGGSAGSTGGGVKIVRHLLLVKNSWLEMKRAIHQQAIIPVKYNHKSVSKEIIFNVMAFFLIYVLIIALGVVVLAITGLDFETSIGATIATLGNIGPGIGGVGPVENYAFFSPFAKWFLSFLMLLGRLELFTVLIVMSPAFWRR
ncbi:MAG: TrkH family potassium uptake protein [Bacteroidales bacterium]|nr:TrkH family potassium uptake protein [Bacteroidales bacterium]MCF6342963.1 TrkH family potassium uptake protein [Bacteroidales bacterium]